MVIDVHTHIFPPDVIADRQAFFDKEPDFQLLYGHPKAKMASAEDIIKAMDENGIDRSVVFGFPWSTPDLMTCHNQYVLASAAKYPDRLVPLACLDLLSPGCVREAEKACSEGFAGFGELAVYSKSGNISFALENLSDIALLCREKELVILVHANEPVGHHYPGKAPFGLDLYYEMVKATRGATLILAHWGGGLFFFELLKKQDPPELFANVYYDTAASPFLYKSDIYKAAIEIAGAERILFGSDYPLLPPSRYFAEITQAGISEPELAAIKGENAARVFGLNT